MKWIFILVIIVITCAYETKPSEILVFVPSPWKSHIVSFQPLFLELAHRGHNVTIVSKYAVKNPPNNFKQVIVKYETFVESMPIDEFKIKNTFQYLMENYNIRNKLFPIVTESFLSSSDVKKFIKEDRSTFDLVIVESFFQECTVAMGHKYDAPVISINPLAPWLGPSRWAANPSDSSYIKDFALDEGKTINFQKRILNAIFNVYSTLIEPIIYIPKMEYLMNTHFQYPGYEKRPSMTQMLKNISLSLIDSDIMVLSPRPYVPSFIEVPGIHLKPTQNMNKKLQYFMDEADMGVVYFNFGTILDVTTIQKSNFEIILNVLGRLDQKVVFKWSDDNTQKFPDNFYVDSWLPQQEILKHPNCKLFITHGGIHGLMETIDAGVPIIGFPVFGDQFQNLRVSQENGFCIIGDIYTVVEETFEKDVKLILTDRKFTENAKKMSSIFNDRPIKTLDKAVYWVEYVIRHKGAHHLRTAAVELEWYQYYSLDVMVFLISLIMLFMSISYLITKRIMIAVFNLLFKLKKIKIT